MGRRHIKISFNSPAILGFTAACTLSFMLNAVTNGRANSMFFSVYRSSLLSPAAWFRFIGHVFGHAGWEHFIGNTMMILAVGPLLEEKYGTRDMACVIGATALVTGIVHFVFFPGVMLLGASGVAFSLILLSSFTNIKDMMVPATFLLVAAVYIGEQIFQGLFVQDNVSSLTHIIGGAVGAGLGHAMNKERR